MSKPKKQHYVPKVYLKNFSFGTVKSPKIYVLSVNPTKIYQANISDTAAERNFYTIEKYKDKYIWENNYANNVEPMLGSLLKDIRCRCENSLVQNNSLVLSSDEKVKLSLNIILQLLRGKQTRRYNKHLYDKLLPIAIDKARHLFYPLDEAKEKAIRLFETDNEYFKEISMLAIFNETNIKKFLDIMVRRNFIFYRIIGHESFITSDNPVLFIDANTQDATPFKNGILKASTLIYYPISSKLLLGTYNSEFGFGAIAEKDCRLEIIYSDIDIEFINTQNYKQKTQCYNNVYAQTKEALERLINKE